MDSTQTRRLQAFLTIAEAVRLDLGPVAEAIDRGDDPDDDLHGDLDDLHGDVLDLQALLGYFVPAIVAALGVQADPAAVARLRASMPPCPTAGPERGNVERRRAEWPLPVLCHRLAGSLIALDRFEFNEGDADGGLPLIVVANRSIGAVLAVMGRDLSAVGGGPLDDPAGRTADDGGVLAELLAEDDDDQGDDDADADDPAEADAGDGDGEAAADPRDVASDATAEDDAAELRPVIAPARRAAAW